MRSLLSIRRVLGAAGVAVLVGSLKAALAMPEATALGAADALFGLLALGWVLRSVVHGLLGYFFPIHEPGVPKYRLMRLSILNAIFAVLWLSTAWLLIEHPNPALTAVAVLVATFLAFIFSLRTHAAAKAAGLERGSEWMRDHLRDPLDPGAHTVIGWPLIKILEWPSSKKYLSPYVAGTLAVLAVALLLVLPGAVKKAGGSNEKGPDGIAGRAPKNAPQIPPPSCNWSMGIRS